MRTNRTTVIPGWAILVLSTFFWTGAGHAQPAKRTLVDWPHAILSPTEDSAVERAHSVMSRLLRFWNGPRLPPRLHVIDDPAIWAESLPAGVILISRGAVALAQDGANQQSDSRLAFALAHEVAHQRADHLWQHGFFARATTTGGNEAGPEPSMSTAQEREAMEQQADAEGLTLAALAGFDVTAVINEHDFFTAWVERVRMTPCKAADTGPANAHHPCAQARQRAERARNLIRHVAAQTVFFELGTQAYAAGAYALARYYYELFGNVAPSAPVHTNIGLTHLAEALALGRMPPNDTFSRYTFHYPIILSESPLPSPQRNKSHPIPSERQALISRHLEAARVSFESVARLNPQEPNYLAHLIVTYLLQNNIPMARGLLDGKLIPQYGDTAAAYLLRGITLAMEDQMEQAHAAFLSARSTALNATVPSMAQQDLIAYAATANLERLHSQRNDMAAAAAEWRTLHDTAQRLGRHFLARVAQDASIKGVVSVQETTKQRFLSDVHHGLRVNNHAGERLRANPPAQKIDLAANRRSLLSVQYADGTQALIDERKWVLAVWQAFAADRAPFSDTQAALRELGAPDRLLVTEAGVYWAFDRLQWGLRWVDNRVVGAFQYPSEQLASETAPLLRAGVTASGM